MRACRRPVRALIAVCVAGCVAVPAGSVRASDENVPASGAGATSQPVLSEAVSKLREVLRALDAMPKTETRSEIRARVAAAIERFESANPLSPGELDELMNAVRAVMPPPNGEVAKPSQPAQSVVPSQPVTPGTQPRPPAPVGATTPPKPGQGDQTKSGTTKPTQADGPAAALQRALALLSSLPASAEVDTAKAKVSALLSRIQRGEKPTQAEMEEVSKTLAVLLESAGSKPVLVPSSAPATSGSQPGMPPQTGPQQSAPSAGGVPTGARPGLEDQLTKISTVLQTLPQSAERDGLVGEVNTLIANLRSGVKPAPAEVQAVMNAAVEMLKSRSGTPDGSAAAKKQPSAEQVRAKVAEIMQTALKRLAEAPEGSDAALVVAAKSQAEAVLEKVKSGATPAKTEVDAVIVAVQAALGGAKNIRASFALSGAIAAMEASKAPDEVKTSVTEILREALEKVESSDESPEEQAAIVRAALEQARETRLGMMLTKLNGVVTVLMAEAERVSDQNSVVALYAALAMIAPEGGAATRESLNEARMLIGDVARRLGAERGVEKDSEAPENPESVSGVEPPMATAVDANSTP